MEFLQVPDANDQKQRDDQQAPGGVQQRASVG
jgi:hypothetical protein